MKKILIFWALGLFVGPAFSQTIYIANSNPGATGGTRVYTGTSAIINAVAAASNGDIIYVVPSSVTYSGPSLNGKSVTIIGGGFNPDKPNGVTSTLTGIYANANNWRVSGLVFNSEINIPGSFSNIMIDKCYIKGGLTDGSGGSAKGNLIIQNCLITVATNGAQGLYVGVGSTSVRISNNIIYVTSGPAFRNLNGATLEHNLVVGSSGSSTLAFNTVTSCEIRNNIFYGVRPIGTTTFTDNVFQNNLSFGASDNTFATTNGNSHVNSLEGVDPLFTNFPLSGSFSFSYDPHPGAPAIGAGLNGTDIGLFGGLTPYDIYGTSLPLVQSVEAPGSHAQGTNMTIRVQAKGN
jgi:hypothetical protein